MKKPTKTTVKKQADTLWSKAIRSLGRCERCGTTEKLQAAHFITRSNHTTRWDLDNGICLCAGCHLFWAHKEIQEFVEWFQRKYPTRYKDLMGKKNEIIPRTLDDYIELRDKLKREAERLL